MNTESSSSAAAPSSCPYCLGVISAGEVSQACPSCHAVHHPDCWEENGGCAVYGCGCAPAVESRRAIEVPMSYWGQENKPCPACGQQIQAAAVRCRHCGTTFSSARPQDAVEFRNSSELAASLPRARRRIITLFVLSVVPFVAPIGLVWGWFWGRSNREAIAALPPLYGALSKIALITAMVQTSTIIVTALLYGLVRGA